MNNKTLTVVDLNTGLGERAYTLANSGFNVLAVTEPNKDSADICRSVLNDVNIIEKQLHKITPEEIPESDILVGNLFQFMPSSSSVLSALNDALTKIIMRNAPKILLFQVSSALIEKNNFEFLSDSVRRRYSFSYRSFKECEYSGFPVVSVQTYVIGIRNDLPHEHSFFPYMEFNMRESVPAFEASEQVADWYRSSIDTELTLDKTFKKGKYYCRSYSKELFESKRIHFLSPVRETFICDEIGLRRFTHNEYSSLKGITYYNFNNTDKPSLSYRKILRSSNLYIFEPMIQLVRKYLEALSISDSHPIDFPEKEIFDKKTKRKKKGTSRDKDNIFKPQNKLNKLHITELKGLKNLDIEFTKNLTAIMGVNGVGKSTILHALACVFSPIDNGEDYKFNFFFTPTPDASWQNSCFSITYFDEIKQKEIVREYKKNSNRWSPKYSTRPQRDVFYIGIDSCLPEIERERQTSYIDYLTKTSDDKLSARIVKDASFILNKDYKELTDHTTKRKKLFGVRIHSGIIYSSLSMGAGEQRVLKILSLVSHAAPYSMILIDELDLLLHASALVNLLRVLDEMAKRKNLQIIFTTHSLLVQELTDIVDIKYLRNTKEKTFVYNAITPDIVYDLSQKSEHRLNIYVEDDLASAVVSKVLSEMKLLRHSRIQNIGSIQNAFVVSAASIIEGRKIDDMLVITDGDLYRTDADRKSQIKKVLSGSEKDHDEKIEKALSMMTELSLPDNTPPEKHIFDMLISMDSESEILECARFVNNVNNSHDWLNKIIEQMNQSREIVLRDIIELVSEHPDWCKYTQKVRDKIHEKASLLKLI